MQLKVGVKGLFPESSSFRFYLTGTADEKPIQSQLRPISQSDKPKVISNLRNVKPNLNTFRKWTINALTTPDGGERSFR